MTNTYKTVTKISKLSPTYFVTNICHQHHRSPKLILKIIPDASNDSTLLSVQVFNKTRILCSIKGGHYFISTVRTIFSPLILWQFQSPKRTFIEFSNYASFRDSRTFDSHDRQAEFREISQFSLLSLNCHFEGKSKNDN